MKPLTPLAATLAVASAWLAGPAMAGDARCLLENLPAEKRAQVSALYAESIAAGLDSSVYTDADYEAVLAACKVVIEDGDQLTAAAQALAGYEAETGAALWFETNRDIDDKTLQTVWKGTRLADPTIAEAAVEDDDLTNALVFELAAKLGLESPEDVTNLAAYVSARLLRQASERRF